MSGPYAGALDALRNHLYQGQTMGEATGPDSKDCVGIMVAGGQGGISSKCSSMTSEGDASMDARFIHAYRPLAGSIAGKMKIKGRGLVGRDVSVDAGQEVENGNDISGRVNRVAVPNETSQAHPFVATREQEKPTRDGRTATVRAPPPCTTPQHEEENLGGLLGLAATTEAGRDLSTKGTREKDKPMPIGHISVARVPPRAVPQSKAWRRVIFPNLHGSSPKTEERKDDSDSEFVPLRRNNSVPSDPSDLSSGMEDRLGLISLDGPKCITIRPLPQIAQINAPKQSDKELLDALEISDERTTAPNEPKPTCNIPSSRGHYNGGQGGRTAKKSTASQQNGTSQRKAVGPTRRVLPPQNTSQASAVGSKMQLKTFYQPSTLPRYLKISPDLPSQSRKKPLISVLRKSNSLPPEPCTDNMDTINSNDNGIAQPPPAPPLSRLPSDISGENGEIGLSFKSPILQPDLAQTGSCDSGRSSSPMRKIHSARCLTNQQTEPKINLTKKENKKLGNVRRPFTRHESLEEWYCKTIKFDACVRVFEYDKSEKRDEVWYTAPELDKFKSEAITRIRQRQSYILPSGTGRIAIGGPKKTCAAFRFSDPALGAEAEEDSPASIPTPPVNNREYPKTLLKEIRNILVIDSHDLFLGLFTKFIHGMMNHALVTTARNPEEALRRIAAAQVVFPQSDGGASHGFDIIICEERLPPVHHRSAHSQGHRSDSCLQSAGDDQNQCSPPSSGSKLLRQLSTEQQEMMKKWRASPWWEKSQPRPRLSLFVGVSAHLSQDKEKLANSGADLVWGKPPPSADAKLCSTILKAVLEKRGKKISN